MPTNENRVKAERVVAFLANLGTILLVVVPLTIGALSSSAVTIEEEQTPSTLPVDLSTTVLNASNELRSEKRPPNDHVSNTLRELSQKVLRVTTVEKMTLTNRSNSTVRELSIRVPHVLKAEFYSVDCDACTQEEKQAILALCKLDLFSNHVVIGPIPKLHPHSRIVIWIFGTLGVGLEQTSASYANGDARHIKSEKVEGLAAVVAQLGPYGFLVLALLFAGVQVLNRTPPSKEGAA